MSNGYLNQKPIRVLQVVTTMNRGGLETMLMNYYRHIDRNKVQFDFLIHREDTSDYENEIIALGGKIYRLSKLNPFSLRYRRNLTAFLKKHSEYKIIHVHQDCLSSIALKAAYKVGIPVRIAHSHSASQDKNIKYLIKKIYKKSIPVYATHLFACGKDAGEWMFENNDFKIVRNAINSKSYIYNENIRSEVRKKLKIKDEELVIGHVGRFNYPKNHRFLIDIFREILNYKSNVKLLLVGTGELEEKIKDKVSKLGINNQVIFMGKRNDVNNLMQAMDIFIFPSNYEGLPVTLIEAQAAGLPIVKSDHVSDQCIISPNVYTVSLKDQPKDWAEKTISILGSFKRSDTSNYIINSHYDISTSVTWLENFYEEKFNEYKK